MKFTRRDFVVTTALGAGLASVGQAPPPVPVAVPAEVAARYDWIMKKWGDRLTDEQKSDIRRMLTDNEKGLAAMRAFPLGNETEPAR
jgi:hypothetical protein